MKLARGFVMLLAVLPLCAQYAGPAILSRGEAPSAMAAPQISFRPFLSIGATYSTGLSGVGVADSQGNLPNDSSYGASLTAGVSGVHSWKHTRIGLDYSGSYYHFAQASYYDSISQGFGLGITHQLSRHMVFNLHQSAGMFSRSAPAAVALTSTLPFDPATNFIPTTDFYDNRTIYLTTQASMTIQRSTRLSFNLGGGLFTNVRRSSALYGAVGLSATGDVQYRVSRRATIGASYSFNHYGYSHDIASTFVHGAAGTFSLQVSRRTEFSAFVGFSRVESNFVQTVALDPALAALLGVSRGTLIAHQLLWAPNFSARLSRSFQHGVAYVSAGESIQPGNGLFLASRAVSGTVGYGYTGLRKWSVSTGLTYNSALSFGNIQGNYGNIAGSFGLSRTLVRSVSFVASFNGSKYRSGSFDKYNRVIYSASIGLGFAPGNVPVRLW